MSRTRWRVSKELNLDFVSNKLELETNTAIKRLKDNSSYLLTHQSFNLCFFFQSIKIWRKAFFFFFFLDGKTVKSSDTFEIAGIMLILKGKYKPFAKKKIIQRKLFSV